VLISNCVLEFALMAKRVAKKVAKRVPWTRAMHAELRRHSKAKTPVAKIAKQMKRSEGALRQQALKLGIGLGHRR
jgi:ribosomal protein S3